MAVYLTGTSTFGSCKRERGVCDDGGSLYWSTPLSMHVIVSSMLKSVFLHITVGVDRQSVIISKLETVGLVKTCRVVGDIYEILRP